jgi:hypothetical protein
LPVNGFGGPPALVRVALEAAAEAFVIVRFDVDLEIEPAAHFLVVQREDAFDQHEAGGRDSARRRRTGVSIEQVHRLFDRFPARQCVDVADGEVPVQ